MNLGPVENAARRESKAFDAPIEMFLAAKPLKRRSIAKRRFANLSDLEFGPLQTNDLVTQCERDLPTGITPGMSSRTNDHCSIVTGSTSIPLTGLRFGDWANVGQATVIGAGRATSP